jgi:hypothetical protein
MPKQRGFQRHDNYSEVAQIKHDGLYNINNLNIMFRVLYLRPLMGHGHRFIILGKK